MTLYELIPDYESILCLNGDLPHSTFFPKNKPIIAADGAANQLKKMAIDPLLIIGDLDSVNLNHFPNSKIIHTPDQNKNDFEKALEIIKSENLMPALILGVGGGMMDHVLNNINIIIENKCIFYAPPLLGYILSGPTTYERRLTPNTKLSLFGMARAKITTKGLKWNLEQEILEFPGKNSSLNRTLDENIHFEIHEGTILLLIYEEEVDDHGGSLSSAPKDPFL
jgi:thiamine pyrophosphokinase